MEPGLRATGPCVPLIFGPRAFSLPALALRQVWKGFLRGPNLVNFDTRLFKEFKLSKELMNSSSRRVLSTR